MMRCMLAIAAAVPMLCAAAVSPDDFTRSITITVSGYQGSTELSDFPVLVRLKAENFGALGYNVFNRADTPSTLDLAFFDSSNTELPYEIDTWNTSGESLLWVRLRNLSGTETSFKACFGAADAPEHGFQSSAAVWAKYAAVWHMNSDELDATGHSLAQTTAGSVSAVADNGILGRGFSMSGAKSGNSVLLANPKDYTNVKNAANNRLLLTVSGWFKPNSDSLLSTTRLICWKESSGRSTGIDLIANYDNSRPFLMLRGSGDTSSLTPQYWFSWSKNVWTHIAGVYGDGVASAYVQGVLCADSKNGETRIPNTGVGESQVGFGNMGGGDEKYGLSGELDELRFYNGVASSDWIRAEHDTVSSDSFLNFAQMQTHKASIAFGSSPSTVYADGGFLVSVSVIDGIGEVYSVMTDVDGGTEVVTKMADYDSNEDGSTTISGAATGLVAGHAYRVGVRGVSEGGVVTDRSTEDIVLAGEVTITRIADADEATLTPGVLRVSRAAAEGAAGYDLTIPYTVSASSVDAVAGRSYAPLSGAVTIPSGETYADIAVVPYRDRTLSENASITLTLRQGAFLPGVLSASASIINDADAPDGVAYVSTAGSDEYDGTAADFPKATLMAAVVRLGAGGGTIHVAEGEYLMTDIVENKSICPISTPVQIVGVEGDATKVVFRHSNNDSSARIFRLDNSDAALRWLTIHGGGFLNEAVSGGNIYISENGGVVEDCIVRNGYVGNGSPQSGTYNVGGGNIRMEAGRVSRCQLLNGALGKGYQYGSGIYAEGGLVENCVIAFGHESDNVLGGGSVRLGKNARMVNCTIVANVAQRYPALFFGQNTEAKSVVNCVLWANRATSQFTESETDYPEVANRFISSNFANCVWDRTIEGSEIVGISEPGFRDIESVDTIDVSLLPASELVERGDASLYVGENINSARDLYGHARVFGGFVDIGAAEYFSDGLEAVFRRGDAPANGFPGEDSAMVSFEIGVGDKASAVTQVEWNFGDGNSQTTQGLSTSHEYAKFGDFEVTAVVTAGDESAIAARPVPVKMRPRDLYASSRNAASAAEPYDTPAKACASIADVVAYAIDGCTVHVAPGTYSNDRSVDVKVDKAVSLVGEGASPAEVVVPGYASDAGKRNMSVTAEGAFVCNMTLYGGFAGQSTGGGGNLYISAGIVSNCILSTGRAYNSGSEAGGAKVIGGLLTHCVVSNSWNRNRGSAVTLAQTGGRVSNCLIGWNKRSWDNTRQAASAVSVSGGVMDNCTIVGMALLKYNPEFKYQMSGKSDTGVSVTDSGKAYNLAIADFSYWIATGDNSATEYTGVEKPSTWVGTSANFVNCVTDDATPINTTCHVGTTATMFSGYAERNLLPRAALRNRGTSIADYSFPSVDLLGRSRIYDNAIDVGCFESHSTGGLTFFIR